MGYYTYYDLQAQYITGNKNGKMEFGTAPNILIHDLEEEIDKMDIFESGDYKNGWSVGEAKWYDHDDDMLLLAHRFPEFLFTLYGEGEDHDDSWYNYYHDGKMQDAPAQIKYEDFDPKKLFVPVDTPSFAPDAKYSYQS